MIHKSYEPGRFFCPQPLYVAGCNNEDGSPSFATVSRLNFAIDDKPSVIMIIDGARLTLENIERDPHFTLSIVNQDLLWVADYLGSVPTAQRKKDDFKLEIGYGVKVKAPILIKSPWIIECVFKKAITLEGSVLTISEIVNLQVALSLGEINMDNIDLKGIDPVLYAPYNYFSLGERLGACEEWISHKDRLPK